MNYLSLASSNILLKAYYSSDGFGKMIFFMLFLLSIVTWYILITKYRQIRHLEKQKQALDATLEKTPNFLEVRLESQAHPFEKIAGTIQNTAWKLLQKNHHETTPYLVKDDIEMLYESAGCIIDRELKLLQKELVVLSTIITLAPFLGILGTVWGILISLTGLGEGASLFSNQNVLSGLTTALATTVLGLVIAIPALIFHNYIKNRISYVSSSLVSFSHTMIENIEMLYRKVQL